MIKAIVSFKVAFKDPFLPILDSTALSIHVRPVFLHKPPSQYLSLLT